MVHMREIRTSLAALVRSLEVGNLYLSLCINAYLRSAFTSLILIRLPGFYHVSRTISVHMAQDDSTYRGRNGIGCFHVSP